MDSIGTIASIIAAITGIVATITGIITVMNSKWNVIKRIERKQKDIQDLDNWFARTYGLNDRMKLHYDIQMKKEKLESDIEDLRKRI